MTVLILKAGVFADAAHAAVGQLRKYTNEPYAVHPREVALLVQGVGGDEEMIAAALLHDVVEDTKITLDHIRSVFGEAVSSYVEMVTDVSTSADGNRKMRKYIDLIHTSKASPGGKTIKLADLISNTKSIVKHDPDFARIYLKEKEALLEVLKEGNALLYAEATRLLKEGKASLGMK